MLIVHPDHLISATVVADSFECTRRAVLQDRVKATSKANAPQVYGHILHEVFQGALKANRWDGEWLEKLIETTVTKFIESIYELGHSDTVEALGHLKSKMPELEAWARVFVRATPGSNAVVNDRHGKTVHMSVSKLLDVEEHVWSPTYGLKGNIDATVQVAMRDEQGDRTLTVPFEVKTGKNNSNASHRAQTALYTLLLSDRYDVEVAYGILYYLETSDISRIPAIRNELRHMVMQRNELACYVRERLQLPPMIQNPRKCGGCYAKTACFIYHKLAEDGTTESSGAKEKFKEVVRNLKPIHQEFFKKWDELLSKEESEMMKFRRELWTMLSSEREKLGRCFANVVIEAGSALETQQGGKINRFQYTLVKRKAPSGFSFTESQIAIGEPIVISDEKGHFALANGYVTNVRKRRITVAVDRRLHNSRIKQPGFDALRNQAFAGIMSVDGTHSLPSPEHSTDGTLEETLYRLDKDEFSNGMALVRNNLVQIMDDNNYRAFKLRSLIVENTAPIFKPSPTAYDLSGPQSQLEINSDQRVAIEKVMAAQDYALVLGMPGTGKTTTIAHIIRALVAKGKSVLLTSYTHTAVDNILLKIRKDDIRILRLGAIAKVHPEVEEFAELAGQPRSTIEELEDMYMNPQVVATTCLGINHAIF
ncbi:DNA replication endonuclease-helicase Dna2, partial [Cryomyces antarcticus]